MYVHGVHLTDKTQGEGNMKIKDWSDISMSPGTPKIASKPAEAGEGKKGFFLRSLRFQREYGPIDTWSLDFQPPEL